MYMSSQIKIGDKIRFLNSEGGGRVLKIVGKIAYVEDQDGFEIPTPLNECVVVGEKAGFMPAYEPPVISARGNERTKEPEVKPGLNAEADETYDDRSGFITPAYHANVPMLKNDKLNVYLAYLPVDDKFLGREPYESYLVNDSNYMVGFSYLSKEGEEWRLRVAGFLEPNSKIFLDEFTAADLNGMESVSFALIPFKQNEPFELKPAISVELRLDTTRFFKLHSFRENDFFEDGAIIYPLVEDDKPYKSVGVTSRELEEAMKAKANIDNRRPSGKQPARRRKKNMPIEVDLHAGELLETTAGMSSKDILDYQLDYFRKVLDEHKKEQGCKIVFIHGKGEGVLRKAIENELKHKYKRYSFYDASFQEYGFGATMVVIR